MDGLAVCSRETGRTEKVTVRRLQQPLHGRAPEQAVSLTHMCGLRTREDRPSVTLVYELAVLCGVAPTYFLPDDLLARGLS